MYDPSQVRHARLHEKQMRARSTPRRFFPLVAFLVTKDADDWVHSSYEDHYIALDRASGEALLYLEIGRPNLRGPTVRGLIERGVLPFDRSQDARCRAAVSDAGGRRAYRRQETDRLVPFFDLEEEGRSVLLIVSATNPDRRAVLRIPPRLLRDKNGPPVLWAALQRALSSTSLQRICSRPDWDESSMETLQEHLDSVAAQLERADTVHLGASLVKSGGGWVITFNGTSAVVSGRLRGMQYLAEVLCAPREPEGASIPASVLDAPFRRTIDGPKQRGIRRTQRDEYHVEQADVSRLTADEIPGMRADLLRLRAQEEKARAAGKTAVADALEAQCRALEGVFAGGTRFGGQARRRRLKGGDQAEAVRVAINRATKAVLGVHPEAGRHLKASVHCGQTVSYRPTEVVDWEVTAS